MSQCPRTSPASPQQIRPAARLRDRRVHSERAGQLVGAVILTLGAVVGAYAYAAGSGVVPAAPWSPIGQVVEDEPTDAPATPNDPKVVAPRPADGGVNV